MISRQRATENRSFFVAYMKKFVGFVGFVGSVDL